MSASRWMMALRDGRLIYTLGLPGGRKIFPSAWQALINLGSRHVPAGGRRSPAHLD